MPSGFLSFVLAFHLSIRLSSDLLRLFFYLIAFLLFPCVSVWENTHEIHVSYSHTEWYLLFSDSATIPVRYKYSERKNINSCALVNLRL